MSHNTYQPFLDYRLTPNPAVIFPTVVENYDWGVFIKTISKEYYQSVSDFRQRESETVRKMLAPQDEQELFSHTIYSKPRKNNCEKNPRGAGRCPMDFLSLFKSFTCARYMDIDVNSRTVCSLLNSNPAFLERMNFVNNRPPAYRTIDRFDQIMTEYDIWEKAAFTSIRVNIDDKVINPKEECVIIVDTTHIPARAKKGKAIKPCRECPFYKTCTDKILTDDNAGILTKSKSEKYFAHKVGLLTPAKATLPTNFFVNRGETFDGHFLEPLLDDFIKKFSQFDNIDYVVADGTFGSKEREKFVRKKLDAQLVTPINPRRSKEVKHPAHGIEKIDNYGQPICIAGFGMFLLTKVHATKEYLWCCPKLHPESPDYEQNFICEMKQHCSKGNYGRAYRTNANKFPQINWNFPQFSKEAKGFLALRTTIEREISWLKRDLKMESLWKRGKKNVIAQVAKCLISMHLVANVAHKVGCPEYANRIKTFAKQ
jgi:hypothetical protein